MLWLLSEDVAREMRKAVTLGFMPSAEQRAAHERRELEAVGNVPRGMSVAGDTAEIRVEGILTPKPDLFALFFGGGNTTYRDIQAALGAAQADPAIRRVVLAIASPGGTVDGLFETLASLEALKSSGKPVTVRANQAQSAAYAIAAVAGKIRAETPASMFGSLGVAASFFVDDQIVDIANTESPNKRPDLSTTEGQAIVQQELDALYEIFVDAIARGRGTTVDAVKADFGRGSSFVAAEAAKRKMIDAAPRLAIVRTEDNAPSPVATVGDAAVGAGSTAVHGGPKKGRHAMTKEELKAQQPELYASIVAEGKEAGRKEGEAAERDRVEAHLTMGESSGDMKTATESIRNGAAMTAKLQAQYFAAAMNRRDAAAVQTDSNTAGAAVDGPAPAAPAAAKSLLDVFAADLPAKPKTAAA